MAIEEGVVKSSNGFLTDRFDKRRLVANLFSASLGHSFPELQEKCGVAGVVHPDASELVHASLMALQHRGQDGAGIGVVQEKGFHVSKHLGLVSSGDWTNRLAQLSGNNAIGHTRYATTGNSDNVNFVQPCADEGLLLAHNGNIADTSQLKALLGEVALEKLNDSQMMSLVLSRSMNQKGSFVEALKSCWSSFAGSFSCVALAEGKLFAFRDSYGIRPLIYGSVEGGYIVASESVALDALGGEIIADVKPGELLILDDSGYKTTAIADGNLRIDSLEFVYLARPDSVIEGVNVYEARYQTGACLASKDRGLEPDLVIGAPDSAIPAAIGYHQSSNVPYSAALVKNRYSGRTFITSGSSRERAIQAKYNVVSGQIKDKSIVLVEDSIVRGSTLAYVISLLKEAGAREVHLRVASPPVRYPDFLGIATPTKGELFANEMSVGGMRSALGVDSLKFLTVDELVESIGLPENNLNLAHFSGDYPAISGSQGQDRNARTIGLGPNPGS